jgi:hypothetical protein
MPHVSDNRPTRSRAFDSHGRQRGFSFAEILVVVATGTLAFLAGLGLGICTTACPKVPEAKAKPLLAKMRANIDAWRGAYKATTPTDSKK